MRIIVKPILPKHFKPIDLRFITQQQLDYEALQVKRDLEITTSTWKHKPVFKIYKTGNTRAVGTADKIYGYVESGTRPHIIRPRRAKALRFNTKYRAKTYPGRLYSRSGGSSPPVAYAKIVHHPGTKARGFVKLIAKRSQQRFPENMDKAIRVEVAKNNQ